MPPAWSRWDCRNNRLAWRGLQADGFAASVDRAIQHHGAHRIGLVLGTSTASIGATEDAGGFVQEALSLQGRSLTLSSAGSSSAKAFAAALRWMQLGLADAVVVGGVDSLRASVFFGFHALQLVSGVPCRPFDIERSGISIEEAAGFVLLEPGNEGLLLLGHGEFSDAHHLSAPDPAGTGAEYAPDLNPDELVWSHAKRTGVARSPLKAGENLQCRVDAQLQNIANDPALVKGFFSPSFFLLYYY